MEVGEGSEAAPPPHGTPKRRSFRSLTLLARAAESHKALQTVPSVPWAFQVHVLSGRMFKQARGLLRGRRAPEPRRIVVRLPACPLSRPTSLFCSLQWIRNPAMLISELVQYGLLALFTGLVWLQCVPGRAGPCCMCWQAGVGDCCRAGPPAGSTIRWPPA